MSQGLKNVGFRHNDSLSRTGWAAVESLLAIYYREQGWLVEHCGTGANGQEFDGGIDLKLRRDGLYVLVQCKHWNAKKVPHNEVHQLIGLMVNEGATGAILVTSGEFTMAAVEAARKQESVELVDGSKLRELIGPVPEPAIDVQSRLPPAPVIRVQRKRVSPWLWVAAGGLLVFVLLIRALLVRTEGSAGPAPVTGPSSPMVADEETPRPSRLPANTVFTTMPSQGQNQPCQEVINAQPGMYGDACGAQARRAPKSAAEIKAEQRRADEAMDIIRDSTPEM